jgi:exonuclease SbcD
LKLLFFFDPHTDSQAPASRIDNYEDTCFLKFEELSQIAKKEGCSYILCSGDFFNRKGNRVSHKLIARSADFFSNISTPFLTISGNHDQFGGDPNTIWDQPLGVLARAANFKILQKEDVTQLDEDTFLTAAPYHAGIDVTPADYFPERPDKAKVHIHLSHGSLIPYKPIWAPYTLYSALKGCKADYVLNGHIHDAFPVETVGNTKIINPGSLTRGSLTEANINRPVSVVILDTATKEVKYVPLKSAMPADRIFDLVRYKELDQAERELDSLGALIKMEAGNVELSGPEGIRLLVKEMKSLKEPVRSKIFELLDRAEEAI